MLTFIVPYCIYSQFYHTKQVWSSNRHCIEQTVVGENFGEFGKLQVIRQSFPPSNSYRYMK